MDNQPLTAEQNSSAVQEYRGPKELTAEQIKARLKALDMYESSVMFSMPDEGDLTTRELFRIMNSRSKLQEMLKAAIAKTPGGQS